MPPITQNPYLSQLAQSGQEIPPWLLPLLGMGMQPGMQPQGMPATAMPMMQPPMQPPPAYAGYQPPMSRHDRRSMRRDDRMMRRDQRLAATAAAPPAYNNRMQTPGGGFRAPATSQNPRPSIADTYAHYNRR